MSSLYDPEMIRRLMAPPEGAEPPGVAKGSRQQAVAQPKRMPPPPQAGATYGGGEKLPPLNPLIEQAMAGQRADAEGFRKTFKDTAPGISPDEEYLKNLAEGPAPLSLIRGDQPGYFPGNGQRWVPGSAPDYRLLYDQARYARENAAKQDERNAALLAARNTPAMLQALAQTESAKIAAESPRDVKRQADMAYMKGFNDHLAMRPNDFVGAAAQGKVASDAVLSGLGGATGGPPPGPPPSPNGEFQPPAGMPAAPTTPSAVTAAMTTYNVIPKASTPGTSVSPDINAKGLVEMLMAENGLRNQYPEVARQALTSGIPEGNVLMPAQRELVRLANAAMPDGADKYQAGPYTVRRTKTGSTSSFDPRTGAPVSGGGVVTGYNIFGPGLDQGIWHSRGVLSDPMGPPLFSTDKSRGDANERASLLANVLQQLMLQKARMAPPQNAVPPK